MRRVRVPRTIGDAQVDAVIGKTLDSGPNEAKHWSKRTMTRESSLTQAAVSPIWQDFGRNRTARRPSSCPPTRCSWTRFATSWGSTWLCHRWLRLSTQEALLDTRLRVACRATNQQVNARDLLSLT